ncbi:MAG: NADH-quinone oxidoreductase subunit NuoG [Planctomycetota bacterium]|jgi:NADH-quinone oxidoreductase subunit G
MVTIYIDSKPHDVKDGQNLLQAVLGLGFHLPYFCWHPALGSVGACRQCAVKQFRDEGDERGMIVMACMTPVSEGLRISLDDPEAVEFRAAVIEWLMSNHPHDCPICDEGGECHLQDMTVMSGHTYRKHRFNKRTFSNQDLGPFINHEMNRCIQCYRCVRYYHDYAGGRDLNCFASRNRTYFGRSRPGVLESPFSGNLVEVCPTGVFTDKTLKQHYTRKWDLASAPSLCTLCSLGCNILTGERYGTLRRVLNRYHGQVNGYFLCDRGRYGYEFVNSERRIRQPRFQGKAGSGIDEGAAVEAVARLLEGSSRVIGIGSSRASLEVNFSLRSLVGEENFFNGMGRDESRCVQAMIEVLIAGHGRKCSLKDAACSDAVLVLGEDVTGTAPLLELALRQALRQAPMARSDALKIPRWNDFFVRLVAGEDRSPLFVATPSETALDDLARGTVRAVPDDIARFGFAVAHSLNPEAPAVDGLSEGEKVWVAAAAEALKEADRPLIVAGASLQREATIRAAANIATALRSPEKEAGLFFVAPECNSLGLGLLETKDLEAAAEAVEGGDEVSVIVVENDLFRRMPEQKLETVLESVKSLVVIDFLENSLTERADALLPGAAFAESGGTLVNQEGRAQRFFPVFLPEPPVRPAWKWIDEIRQALHSEAIEGWEGVESLTRALAEEVRIFAPIIEAAPPRTFRRPGGKVPRQSHRYSGRTAMAAHLNVNEPRPPADEETPLAYSMEGSLRQPPSALITRYCAPAWSSVSSLNRFQEEIGGPLRGGDPGILLIVPASQENTKWFTKIPAAFEPREGDWLMVPLYHIFGSEPLSLETPAVAEQAPGAYLALGARDAEKIDAQEGDIVGVEINSTKVRLPLKVFAEIPDGLAGMPVGLPEMPVVVPETWIVVTKKS